jgi:hypothetical protein
MEVPIKEPTKVWRATEHASHSRCAAALNFKGWSTDYFLESYDFLEHSDPNFCSIQITKVLPRLLRRKD